MTLSSHLLAAENAKKPAYCIAHRGDSKNHLENSFSALRSAYALGADGMEFDLHHTKDDIAILMHDKKLARVAKSRPGKTCPLKTKIKNLNLVDIQNNCLLKNDEEIPLLSDVLKLYGDSNTFLFIEVKDKPSASTLADIKQFVTYPKKVRIIGLRRKNLKPFKKLRKHDEYWQQTKLFKVAILPIPYFINYGFNSYYRTIKWLRLYKKKTKEYGIWTIDKEKQLKKAFLRGFKFLTTNKPALCLQVKQSYRRGEYDKEDPFFKLENL